MTIDSAPTAPTTLSARLRTETKDAHLRAERSGIMRQLLRGDIDRAAYAELLANLAAIYDALESELDRHAADPALALFELDALRRLPALRADLASLGATANAPNDALRPAAREYAARLHALGAGEPVLLAAHAYVRYMGDLSGGQILKRIVARALSDDAATAFYDFAGDPDALKARFRDAVDALPSSVADDLTREAQLGFALHERLFTELTTAPGGGA